MLTYRGQTYNTYQEYLAAVREPTTTYTYVPPVEEKVDESVDIERTKLYVRGLSGLKNQGNTCYMNSILQCLSAISLFRACLINDEHFTTKLYYNTLIRLGDEKRKKESIPDNVSVKVPKALLTESCNNTIVYRLAELFNVMWKQNATVTPKKFKKTVGDYCSIFSGYSQNDSQELLNLILDKIHEELKSEVKVIFQNVPEGVNNYLQVKMQCSEKINDEGLSIEEKQKYLDYLHNYTSQHRNDAITSEAYLYWRNYIRKSHSVITDLFTGLFYSKITCSECNSVTGSFEPFTMLSLPTKEDGETTLEESLNSFVKEELLTGDNKYSCSECKKKVDATKKMHIWSPPNILIVQLKRFKNDSWRTTKTSSKVVFPIKGMDIKNYLSDLHAVEKTTYDLVAISEHRGSCNSGHYVAYCKNDINEKWYEFNDDDIFHVPYEELDKEIITKNAYILFYVRNIN